MDSTFKATLLLISGRALGFAATFFVPVVLVRIFDQAEFGTYKQLFLIYGTLYGIAQLGMAESLFYFIPSAPREAGKYVLNSIVALALLGVVGLTVLGTSGASISRWLSNSELAGHVPLVGVYLALMLTSAMLEIVMISRARYRWAAFSYAFSDVLRTALFILPVLLLRRLEWLLLGGVVFALLRLASALFYIAREFDGTLRPDFALMKRQLTYALPFQLAVIIEIVQANFHQYAVSYRFDAAMFAIYSIGCLQIPFVDFMASSAANVMMVRMAEATRDGRGGVLVAVWHETTRRLALVFFPMVALLLVNAREIILFLFTESYVASVPIFMVWSSSMLLAVLSVDGVMRVFAETRFLVVLNAVRLALVLGLMGWFLSTFGLLGGVLVTVLATCVGKGLGVARMMKLLHVGPGEVLPWRSLVEIFGAAAAASAPTLLLKLGLEMPVILGLVVTSVAYAVSYFAALRGFGVLRGREWLDLRDLVGRLAGS